MIWIFIIIFLLMLLAVIVDVPTMVFLLFIYSLGIIFSLALGGLDRKVIAKIFCSIFAIGSIYMLMTFLYMTLYNYNTLLSYDSYYYFIPKTELYITKGSYIDTIKAIWDNYDFFNRDQVGYFTYATLFGYLSNFFGANFYLGQQISVLLLYSFVGVVIYKLFKINNFTERQAYKYTLIICIFSILFFYSSQILRDVHILLLYLLGIHFTFKKEFSLFNIIKIVIVIYICTTLRLESGLFMIILIPTYLLLSLQQSNKKIIVVSFSGLIALGAVSLSMVYLPQVNQVVEANQEAYGDDKGDGVIGTLQKVPIAGDIASIVYNAAQPIPFWSRLSTMSSNKEDHSVYNIMNFPRSFASFFNWMVIVYILFWLFSKKTRRKTKSYISKPLLYQLLIGLVFLLLQSAVVSQRRLMAYYVVFYILFFIIYRNLNHQKRKQVNALVVLSFILIQIVGFVYLL